MDFLTVGQYLRPSARHLPVEEYVAPETFDDYKRMGEEEYGFRYVASGPLVRSSYRAGELFIGSLLQEKRTTINEVSTVIIRNSYLPEKDRSQSAERDREWKCSR